MQRLLSVLIGFMAGCLVTSCHVESGGGRPIAEEAGEANPTIGSGLQDAQMVAELADLEYGVIMWSKTAGKQSKNSTVSQTADELEQDHALLLKQLQQYAANRNMHISGAASSTDERELNSMLKSKKPAGFEKEWCAAMLKRHEKIIAAMEDGATIATDTMLRTWINDVLPKVRMHRDKLMQIKYTIR
jgi:predicted outer membrane protein